MESNTFWKRFLSRSLPALDLRYLALALAAWPCLGGAEFGGGGLLIDPILHGAIRWYGPSNVLAGLCSVPGYERVIKSSYIRRRDIIIYNTYFAHLGQIRG